jgi:hypothetical protein
MSDTPAVTLELLAQQQAKMLAEMTEQRADIDAMLSIIQRLDAAVVDLLSEVRALQARIGHHGHLPFDAFDQMTGSQPKVSDLAVALPIGT